MSSEFHLSTNVVQKLLYGDEFPTDSIVVQLSYTGSFRICDASQLWTCAKIIGPAKDVLPTSLIYNSTFVIRIRGYVKSEGNNHLYQIHAGSPDPLLVLTAIDIIGNVWRSEMAVFQALPRLPSARIDAGKVNEFWTLVAPLLSDADLAGSYLFAGHEQAEAIFNLMQKAVDIEKLSKESDVPMTAENQFYHKTLSDFVSSQRNRQHVTITSNPGRLLTDTIVRQHTLALEQALGQDLHATLSPALLCTWHGMLCDEQSHAGVVRPIHVAVRVGYTTFQPSHQVGADLEQLCHLLGALESRLVSTPSLSPSIASMTYAAAVFFSIADLHAFADGNGRLARIAANWALRRFGVPFCVPMFATLEERKEYISAILFTRRNLYIVARGEVLQESLLEVYRNEGCLLPLILLFMNRLYKSVTDFNRLLADQSRTLSDFDDMTGRRFRKRAADGICLM